MDDAPVLSFDDPLALDPRRTGGKGASLTSLTRAGFPVPRGVVVPASAYRAVVAAWPEFEAWVEALPVADVERPEALRDACIPLREAIRSRPFPAGLEEAIRRGTGPVVAAGPVSVRSSATLEDLAGASFAGQHDSYLGVVGIDDVLARIRDCWASLWEDRAVRYRHEQGFGLLEADMAVVVQSMVDAHAAGVAFSIDPITGEAGRILITSAWGLGETVVSGEGEIDQWVLDKASGAVIEERIGEKIHEIVLTEHGTAETRDVPIHRREAPSLGPTHLGEVAALTSKAERHYAFPQDIEWAVGAEGVVLLQSRPVTEFPERWTRKESAERFPNPITPLTWDFTTPGFHESLAYSLALMGMPPFEGEWFKRLDGYIYGNQTAVDVFTAGHQVAFDGLDDLAERVPELRAAYRWVQELPVQWARDLDYYLMRLGRLGSVDLETLPTEAVWAHALEIDRLGREYFLPNIAISISQGLLHRLLFQIVVHAVGQAEAPAVYDGLTCFCETKTGLVNHDLFRLAANAAEEPELRRLLVEENRRALYERRALDVFPEFAARFERFLEIHGHREVDFDAYHPTWSGQPWVVLENLRLILMQSDLEDPGSKDQELRARQRATEQAFLAQVPEPLRGFVGEVVRLARAYTALDDLEHYQTTRLTPPFRSSLIEIGRRLTEEGTLDEPADVFFLRRIRVEGLVRGTVTPEEARAEALEAKAAHERQGRTAPPFRHGEEDSPDTSDDILLGLPGAPGVAEGTVCLLRTPDDFGRFTPGSVLVARTTNPAWTPLFYSAVAVVTESGGPLSHGAVTAREFRIPAVMSVRGALSRLEEGKRVRVDGGKGAVSLL
jgi:phosphohistidine swiveling domain-containing protein